jgi:hypothetical protein
MSRPQVREEKLSPSGQELMQIAALAIGVVLRGELIGLILSDNRGISIVPKPGMGTELFKSLAECDWEAQVRLAEEWNA